MAKEIVIKVKVEGQEITLTGNQINLLKKNSEDLRKEFESLGDRTEQNAEQFDKLKGDLEKLDKVLVEVKEDTKETGDGIEETGDKSEKTAGKVKSLKAQLAEARNALAALGPRTAENADRFDELTAKVQDLSDKNEDLQIGTKKLDDALAAIPGPIGQAASAFKTFDDTTKNLKSAFATLGREFSGFRDNIKNLKISDLKTGFKSLIPSLDGIKTGLLNVGKAILATGIGALVIVIGLLVAALAKALSGFKPLQDALSRFGVLFEVLQDALKPVIELIGNALTSALNFLSKAIAFVTGNLDEFNKKLADKKAAEQAAKNLKKQAFDLETLGDLYTEVERKKVQARLDAANKIKEINADETLDEEEKARRILQVNERLGRDLVAIDKEETDRKNKEAKEAADKAKAAAEKRKQIEEDFQNRLKQVRDENTLLEIKDENEAARLKLKIQLESQQKEINGLEVSKEKKKLLLAETNKNYELQLKALNEKIKKEQQKADNDLLKQIRDIRTSLIDDDKKRLEKEAENRRDDALKAVDESIANEKVKADAKKAINEQYAKDVAKIDEEIAKKNKENLYRQIEFERESRKLGLENRLKEIDLSTQSELAKAKARTLVLQAQAKEDRDAELSNLKKQLEAKEIDQKEFDERSAQRERQFQLTLTDITFKSVQDRQNARQREIDAYTQLAQSVVNLIGVFQKEGEQSKELIKIQEALTFATNIATLANNIQALSELGKAYGKQIGKASAFPFPASIPAIAAVIASFVGVLTTGKQLFGIGKRGGANKPAATGMGRNYEKGGLLKGPRHAQGGIMVEAEGGEAIMSRGAVTLFRPMLSLMNQMGGGTSFTPNLMTTSLDNPVVTQPVQNQNPTVIKTYVVESELTTQQQKQARLKQLSTL